MASEKRLIDANALLEKLKKTSRYFTVKFDIEEAPTVDAVEVVHGRWMCVDTDTEHFFLCNRCKKKEFLKSNYCRSCGAKMDGGADNGC